jgi:cytochrome c
MAGAPPSPVGGRMVAVILLLAIALTIVLVIHFTKPAVDTAEAPPAADPQPPGFYLARADLARGEAVFQRCAPCHTIAPGGPSSSDHPSIGPNLYGVMGSGIAARPGFTYSRGLRGHEGGTWDWQNANTFLHSPRYFAPGTRMAFIGLSDPQDRADVMLYLNAQGGSLAPPAGASGGATAEAAPTFNGPAPDPALTRAFLIGRWATDSCSPPAVSFSADGTTHDGRRWTLDGDRLIVSRGAEREQSVVERLGRDRIRLNTRDGPFELTRCPLLPAVAQFPR